MNYAKCISGLSRETTRRTKHPTIQHILAQQKPEQRQDDASSIVTQVID